MGRIRPKTSRIILRIINGIPITAPMIVVVKTIPIIKQTKAPNNQEVLMNNLRITKI